MRAKRQMMRPHLRLHIRPRRKRALAPDIRRLIQRAVQNTHTEIGHPDLIGIGKTKSESTFHRILAFEDLPILTAAVTAGF